VDFGGSLSLAWYRSFWIREPPRRGGSSGFLNGGGFFGFLNGGGSGRRRPGPNLGRGVSPPVLGKSDPMSERAGLTVPKLIDGIGGLTSWMVEQHGFTVICDGGQNTPDPTHYDGTRFHHDQ
jgi:hypothetical protein